ncbi:MAG: branched-chain amino acid ABC transporter permease, partial [Ilumatobacteraceae bacterium]
QGEMAMMGAFIAYAIANAFDIPGAVAVVIAMFLSAIGAAVIERVLIRPFDPSNHLAIVIVTLSLFLILNAIAGVIWAFDPRAFPKIFPKQNESFSFLGARVLWEDLFTCITVLVAVFLVSLLLRKTKIGLAFRSVSSSLESSRLLGIHIGRTLQFGWAIAAAVGTLAGSLVARTTLLEPNFMGRVLIYSFAAAIFGGLDSLGGAVVAGVIIGLVQTMAGGYIEPIGSELAPAVALLVIVAVLLVRPNGLFGSKRVERV